MPAGNSSSSNSEITVAEKWDHSVENLVRKTTTGFAVGMGGALLCRTAIGRASVMMMGAGFGAGIAYAEARYLFDYDICFDRRHLVKVGVFSPAESSAQQQQQQQK